MCSEGVGGRPPQRGFTLIELMITVAVIGLLAAVAYPSYQSSVLKSRRSEAKAALTDAAQRLERYYTENNKYEGAKFCSAGAGCTVAAKVFEDRSENGHYALDFANAPTVTAFTAVATPQGAQAADVLCGAFTLNEAGLRGVTGTAAADPSKCW